MTAEAASPERTAPEVGSVRRPSPDVLAELEDQRRFLLRSLRDLDDEFAAGDIDETDYRTLKDDYTARAASVLRGIDGEKERFAEARKKRSPKRIAVVLAAVAVVALLAGVLIAQASGSRSAGGSITGDIRQSNRQDMQDAIRLGSQGEILEALMLIDEVLERSPAYTEALTYRGWFLVLTGDPELEQLGLNSLDEAVAVDPLYPEARAFWTIILMREGLFLEAAAELEAFDASGPSPEMTQLVDSIRPRIAEGVAELQAAEGP